MATYINRLSEWRAYRQDALANLASGEYIPYIGFDTETAPAAFLVGYPGTEFTPEGERIKAHKVRYFEYARHVWSAAYVPSKLARWDLFVPKNNFSGKEASGLASQIAWKAFVARLIELGPRLGDVLALCTWKSADVADFETEFRREVEQYAEEIARLGSEIQTKELLAAQKNRAPTTKTARGRLQKLITAHQKLQEEGLARKEAIQYYRAHPYDWRVALHIVLTAVEGRVKAIPESGQNALDPIRPGLDPHTTDIFLAQFTFMDKAKQLHSVIINCFKVDPSEFEPLFRDEYTYLGANIKFDIKQLLNHFTPKGTYFCVSVTSRVLNLGLRMPHTLAAISERYLGKELPKEVRNLFIGRRYDEPTPPMLEYASYDTEVLFPIFLAQWKGAASKGQLDLVRDFSQLSVCTALWEYYGYQIDTQAWHNINAGVIKRRDEVAQEIEALLLPHAYALGALVPPEEVTAEGDLLEEGTPEEGDADDESDTPVDSRPAALLRLSRKQLVATLASQLLGIEIKSMEKTNLAGSERYYRERNRGTGHDFFQKWGLWTRLEKAATTYGKKFLWAVHPLTGKVHPTFTIAGTDTGRYTSSSPNFLNIPAAKEPGDPDFRGAFVAPEGYYLLGADYETMELRIAGDISQDPMILKMVLAGVDAHGFTAMNMFHIEPLACLVEPRLVEGIYRRGSASYDIPIWEIPATWTPEQVADFAIEHGPETLKTVKERYGKDITRTDAKSVTFLWLFQGTPFTLAQRTGLSNDHCEDLFTRFANVYKKMDAAMKELAELIYEEAVSQGGKDCAYVVGYGGIRRYVPLPPNPTRKPNEHRDEFYFRQKQYRRELRGAARQLCNLPMQGGNAKITAEALIVLQREGREKGIYPWLSIYDENLIAVPERVPPEEAKALLERAMLDAARRYMTFVPPGAEADIKKAGRHWKKS